MHESTSAFDKAGERFTNAGAEIIGRLDGGFQKATESITDVLKAHRDEMGKVETMLTRVQERLRELMERLDPRLLPRDEWSRLTGVLEALGSQLEGISAPPAPIPGWQDGIAPFPGDGSVLRDLLGAVERLEDSIKAFGGAAPVADPGHSAEILSELKTLTTLGRELRTTLLRPRPMGDLVPSPSAPSGGDAEGDDAPAEPGPNGQRVPEASSIPWWRQVMRRLRLRGRRRGNARGARERT